MAGTVPEVMAVPEHHTAAVGDAGCPAGAMAWMTAAATAGAIVCAAVAIAAVWTAAAPVAAATVVAFDPEMTVLLIHHASPTMIAPMIVFWCASAASGPLFGSSRFGRMPLPAMPPPSAVMTVKKVFKPPDMSVPKGDAGTVTAGVADALAGAGAGVTNAAAIELRIDIGEISFKSGFEG